MSLQGNGWKNVDIYKELVAVVIEIDNASDKIVEYYRKIDETKRKIAAMEIRKDILTAKIKDETK